MSYPIRYTRTSDHVNIAFCELGQGEPVIYLPALPWSHFSIGFSSPLTARHPEELSRTMRLLIYDARGCGLSDPDADDLSLDGFTRDIDAIAEVCGLERFALYGSADGSRVMIRYAALHPERVSKLILWIPSVAPDRIRADPEMRAVMSLAGRDWETYLRTLSHAIVGGWDAERAPYGTAWANVMRAAVPPDRFPRLRLAMREHDVSADLAAVRAPTLVMCRAEAALYTVRVVSEVAAGIRDAKFVVSPGNWLLPCTGDDITLEIAAFMAGHESDAAPTSDRRGPAWHALAPAAGAMSTGGFPREAAARAIVAERLSQREREVLALLSMGKTNAQIADDLVVAPATASRHVHNILNKLGMSRRAEAAAYAAMCGLTPQRSID